MLTRSSLQNYIITQIIYKQRTNHYRSEGFALTGYVVPGYLEDGAWMLWENSSFAAVVAAVAAVAHPGRCTPTLHTKIDQNI